jgi:uncharacterized RDD family membrane protein YckC
MLPWIEIPQPAFPLRLNPFGVFAALSLVVALVWVFVALTGLLIVNIWLLDRHGQTLGKRLQEIAIVREGGSRASVGRIITLRMLPFWGAGIIPTAGVIIELVNILFIFGRSRRCLHDMFADTIVVQRPPKQRAHIETTGLPTPSSP